MIDVIIPLGTGTVWDNNELRYSLRSIEKHLKNYRDIWIIGNNVDFLKFKGIKDSDIDIYHLNFEDFSHIPSKNIKDKLLYASSFEDISDNFLYWNDDYFLLKDLDATKVPFYHGGDLKGYIEGCSYTNWYRKYLEVTYYYLRNGLFHTLNYDIHYPIIINKKEFILTSDFWQEEWSTNKELLVKSIYLNCMGNRISPEYLPDCKIKKSMDANELNKYFKNKFMFSVGTNGLNESLKYMLDKLYPDKSKYEL